MVSQDLLWFIFDARNSECHAVLHLRRHRTAPGDYEIHALFAAGSRILPNLPHESLLLILVAICDHKGAQITVAADGGGMRPPLMEFILAMLGFLKDRDELVRQKLSDMVQSFIVLNAIDTQIARALRHKPAPGAKTAANPRDTAAATPSPAASKTGGGPTDPPAHPRCPPQTSASGFD